MVFENRPVNNISGIGTAIDKITEKKIVHIPKYKEVRNMYVLTLRHWKLPETNLFYKLVHVPITKFESTNYVYLLLKGCKFAFILLREHFNLINK